MRRELEGKWLRIAKIGAIAFSLFQIYTAGFGLLPNMEQRAVHVLFGFALTFLLVSPRKRASPEKKVPIWDILLILLTIACCANTFFKYEWFHIHLTESAPIDLFLGVAIVLIALEGARRLTGWAFPSLTALMLIYVFVGPYIPGVFRHAGFNILMVIQQLNQTTLGVWGFITGISATILSIFIIFGAFLLFTGGGQTFINIAIWLAGRFRGGPALVAVIASSLFGTVSGSAVVNVATTGNFTIPLMKRLGYKPEFAGGVEAAASAGGQITPPIMGAGAFIMAEILGIPYLKIAAAAIIPAYLFYVAVFAGVRFEALRLNLPPIPSDEVPKLHEILNWRSLGPLFIPVAALLGFLLRGFSPTTAGFWALATAVILFLFSNFSLVDIKQRVKTIVGGLERAAIAIIEIVALSVCANIVVALINMTGLGVKFSGLIIDFSGGSMLLGLIMAAMVALILGMGMVTTAAYLIAASVVGPALKMLGVLPLAAHLFIFFYAIISSITPPICTAAFVASAIARAPWRRIATIAMRLAAVTYLMPFLFVYEPALLLLGEPLQVVLAVFSATIGAVFLGAAMMGYFIAKLGTVTRLLLIGGAVVLLVPGLQTDLVGLAVIALALFGERFVQLLKRKGPG